MEQINEGIFTAIGKRSVEDIERLEDRGTGLSVTPEQFEQYLKEGIVKFTYLKKQGNSIRVAYGTKKKEYYTKLPHGSTNLIPPGNIHFPYTIYYDMEKDDWRLFMEPFVLNVLKKPMTLEQFQADLDNIYSDISLDEIDHLEKTYAGMLNGHFDEIPFLFRNWYIYPKTWDKSCWYSPKKKKVQTP